MKKLFSFIPKPSTLCCLLPTTNAVHCLCFNPLKNLSVYAHHEMNAEPFSGEEDYTNILALYQKEALAIIVPMHLCVAICADNKNTINNIKQEIHNFVPLCEPSYDYCQINDQIHAYVMDGVLLQPFYATKRIEAIFIAEHTRLLLFNECLSFTVEQVFVFIDFWQGKVHTTIYQHNGAMIQQTTKHQKEAQSMLVDWCAAHKIKEIIYATKDYLIANSNIKIRPLDLSDIIHIPRELSSLKVKEICEHFSLAACLFAAHKKQSKWQYLCKHHKVF